MCMCVASFETFGSGSFGGPVVVRNPMRRVKVAYLNMNPDIEELNMS